MGCCSAFDTSAVKLKKLLRVLALRGLMMCRAAAVAANAQIKSLTGLVEKGTTVWAYKYF